MKALVKKLGETGIWMEDVPKPQIGPDELLVKIRKTSICGTDINIYKWGDWSKKNVPIGTVIGHEFVGIVEEVGSQVKGFKVGDRVSGEGHLICHTCRNCRMGQGHLCVNTKGIGVQVNGSFAEYLKIPAFNAFKVPDSIPDNIASIFDPFGNAVHTALAGDMLGEDVLITGAGPIGIMAAAIAKFAGARNIVITDINDGRLELAKKMGATSAVNVEKTPLQEVVKQLGIDGFTFCMEMSGYKGGLDDCLRYAYHGATVALLGILPPNLGVDWDQIIFKCLKVQGIYGRMIFDTWYKMTHMLEAGLDLSPVITHEFKIDDFQKGFDVMLQGKSAKVVLDWT